MALLISFFVPALFMWWKGLLLLVVAFGVLGFWYFLVSFRRILGTRRYCLTFIAFILTESLVFLTMFAVVYYCSRSFGVGLKKLSGW